MAASVTPGSAKKFSSTKAYQAKLKKRKSEEQKQLEEDSSKNKLREEMNKKANEGKKKRSFLSSLNDFTDQAADKIGGGLGRGSIRTLDQLLPGKNTWGLEGFANEWDRRAKTTKNWEGTGYTSESSAGKAGAKVGSTTKGIADLAMIAAPVAAVDKAVKGTRAVKSLQAGGKAKKAAGYVAKTVPGSLTGSAVDAMQEKGRGNDVNLVRSGGVGLGIDLLAPAVLKTIAKGGKGTIKSIKDKVPGVSADDGRIRTKSMADIGKGQRKIAARENAKKSLLDRNAPVASYVKALEEHLGDKLPKGDNPYELLKLRGGTEGQAVRHIEDNLGWINDVPEQIRQDGDSLGYALQYLSQPAKRTPEQIAKAQKTVELLKDEYDDITPLTMYTQKMRETFDTIIDLYEKNGLIDGKHAKNLRDNPNYFAKMEVLQEVNDKNNFGRSSINTKETALKGVKGQSNNAELAHSAEAFVKQTTRAMQDVANNKVGKALGAIADEVGDDTGLIRTAKESTKVAKNETKITYLDQGEKKTIVVPKEIGDILTGADNMTFDIVTSAVGKFHNIFRQAVTTYNPLFVFLRNPARDIKAFMTNSRHVKVRNAVQEYAKGMMDSLTKGQWSKDFLEAGGGQSGFFAREGGQAGKQIARATRDYTKQRGIVSRVVTSPKDFMQKMSEAIEMAPRVAEYKAAIQKGLSPEEAAVAGREVTVDFAQGGNVAKVANQWIPFLNARAQGTRRLAIAFKENPKRAATVWAATGIMPMATLMAVNNNYRDVWENIPDYEKENNFILITGRTANGKGNYIKFPKGDIDKILGNTFESMLDSFMGGSNAGDNFAKSLINGASNVSPVSFANNGSISAGSVMSGILPPLAKAPAEWATNYSYFKDAPIVPESMEGAPANEQVKKTTPDLAKWIGGLLGQSPLKVENAVQNLAGNVPFDITNAATLNESSANRMKRAVVNESAGKTEIEFYKVYAPAKKTRDYREKQIYKLINEGSYKEAQRRADEYNRDLDERFGGYFKKYGAYMPDKLSNDIDPIDLIDSLKIDVQVSKKGKPYIKR